TGTSTMAGVVNGTTNFGTLTEVTGAASKLTIQQQPSLAVTAGVAFGQQPIIRIEDQYGNLRSTDTLSITATRAAGSGTLQGTTTISAIGGVATFSSLSHNVATTLTIQFTSGALASATSDNILVSPASASRLGIQTQSSASAVIGVIFLQQPVVRVEDAFG